MIVILSVDEDGSTNGVIDWLTFFQKDFVRINPTDIITEIRIEASLNVQFTVKGRKVDLKKVSSFWYRRGKLNLQAYQIDDKRFPFMGAINGHLNSENTALSEFVLRSLTEKNGLGDYYNTIVNKFSILMKAKEIGLDIPATIVTTNKNDLIDFASQEGQLITKSCSEMIMARSKNNSVMSYTHRLTDDQIDQLADGFSPSLFQKEIEKEYELRIFYLDGEFFAMAIFSQLDKQTEVDFRVYNQRKPNRCVPYQLPERVKQQLQTLMESFQFSTGSIDMIYTKSKKFVFLEINPVGQFDMVSIPCNYHLRKRIAQRLAKIHHHET